MIIGQDGEAFTCAVAAWNADPDLPPYSDGQGIDHGEEAFNPAIGAILGQCLR